MKHACTPLCAIPFALLALAAPANAQTAPLMVSPSLETLEYGILCHYDFANPNVPMTYAQVNETYASGELFDEVRVEKTLTVPAVPGLVIGVLSSLPDGEAFDVTSIITHTDASGRITPDTLQLNFDAQVEIDAWRFDDVSPAEYGTFRFQTLRGGETIYDVTMTLVAPEAYTGAYPECLTRP